MPTVCGPGFCMAAENASMEVAGSPSTSSMTSPTCIPAFSAGPTGNNPHRSARFVRAESGGSSVGRLESILKESLPNGTATSFGSMLLFRPMTETEIRDAFRSAMGCAASRARKMPGGAGNRNYWRVHGDDGRSAVVMELPPEPAKSEEVSKEAAAQDLPFLNVHRYLERLGVRVPHVYLD